MPRARHVQRRVIGVMVTIISLQYPRAFVDSVIYLEYHVLINALSCRRYTYPGAYAPHPAFQDFDTGGVIRIRHQRFSLIYSWVNRYLPFSTVNIFEFSSTCLITVQH